MELKYLVNNKKHTVKTEVITKNSQIINWNEATKTLYFTVDEKTYKAKIINTDKNQLELYIFNFKKTFKINLFNQNQFIAAEKSDFTQNFEDQLTSPISGRVVKINVKENEQVKKDQILLVIESMKMENEIRVKTDTFIKTISINAGDLVKQEQILMKFEKKGKKDGTTKKQNGKTSVSNR